MKSEWIFGDNSTPEIVPTLVDSVITVRHTYGISGTYFATLRIFNDIECSEEITVPISVGKGYNIMVPNVFTPNGDGINDVFEPLSLISTPVEKFALYDRWGNQVFQTNDPDESWDGRFNGQPLNGGVFVYTLEVMCPDGNAGYHSGNVTLMR